MAVRGRERACARESAMATVPAILTLQTLKDAISPLHVALPRRMQFAFAKVQDKTTRLTKFVLVNWVC
jgi:hypothetical protein